MVVSDRGDAVEMVVIGAWTAEATAEVRAGQIDRLVLNYAHGFDEPSLGFLEGLPLRELVILDPRLSDLTPVHSLGATLQMLSVTTSPSLQVDLGQLPELRVLSAAWSQVEATIESAVGLEVAFLRDYKAIDLRPLAALSGLVELVMKDRPRLRSLVGLSKLTRLRRLGVYLATGLVDIDDLAGRNTLEELALQGCRNIDRLETLSGCTGLRKLNLSECGDLLSLAPIRSLVQLEQLLLFGSTRIVDGDLSPVVELPRLSKLRMQSRRSYRPSVEEVQASLLRD